MNKSKILTVVLTLVTSIIILLIYIAVTKTLISTANTSPIITLQSADNNTTIAEVSSTEPAEEENNKNNEEKITVTSRSGKHEPLQDTTQEVVAETPAPKEETPAPAPAQEVFVEESEPVEEVIEEEKPTFEGVELEYSAPYNITSARLSKSKGVTYYDGHKETYYSQRVLPGNGLKSLNNNGRHVADDGTVRDGDGYIAVACNYLSKGSEIMTSLGPGKVYDTGGMTGKWIDIYVNW